MKIPTVGSQVVVKCRKCLDGDMQIVASRVSTGSETMITLKCIKCNGINLHTDRDLSILLGGHKDDDGKPMIHLIPVDVMLEQAKLWTTGANKYREDNWKEGMDYSRCYNALERHLWAWWLGEEIDPDNGQHHLDSVIWCAIVLRYFQLHEQKYTKFDNRPKDGDKNVIIHSTPKLRQELIIPFTEESLRSAKRPRDFEIGEPLDE